MLGRLGLQFGRRLEVGHERQVDVQAMLLAHIQRELPDGLQERQTLDVADRPTDLRDHHIDLVAGQLVNDPLDLVRDVRDHLDRLAQELAPPLLFDHRLIDLPGRVVAVPGQRAAGEPFVVPQVQVGLAAVVQHVDLAVLIGTHRPRVDVDVRIQLLHADLQTRDVPAACRPRHWSGPCPGN